MSDADAACCSTCVGASPAVHRLRRLRTPRAARGAGTGVGTSGGCRPPPTVGAPRSPCGGGGTRTSTWRPARHRCGAARSRTAGTSCDEGPPLTAPSAPARSAAHRDRSAGSSSGRPGGPRALCPVTSGDYPSSRVSRSSISEIRSSTSVVALPTTGGRLARRPRASATPATRSAASSGRSLTVPTHWFDFHVLRTKKPASSWAETRTPRPSPRERSAIQRPGASNGGVITKGCGPGPDSVKAAIVNGTHEPRTCGVRSTGRAGLAASGAPRVHGTCPSRGCRQIAAST